MQAPPQLRGIDFHHQDYNKMMSHGGPMVAL